MAGTSRVIWGYDWDAYRLHQAAMASDDEEALVRPAQTPFHARFSSQFQGTCFGGVSSKSGALDGGCSIASRVQSTCGGRLTPHFLCPQAKHSRLNHEVSFWTPSKNAIRIGLGGWKSGEGGKVIAKSDDELEEFEERVTHPPPKDVRPAANPRLGSCGAHS